MSNYSIPTALTNVSAVAVSAISADSTLTTGDNLNQSVWAGVGAFARGKPFTALKITKSNFLDVLGAPIHPAAGAQFEPIRHVYEAVQETDGYVVRVVADDAKYPVITFSYADGVITHTTSALAYGTKVELTGSQFLAVYIDDGDPSTARHITFSPDSASTTRFKLKLTETNSLGVTSTLETTVVSFGTDDADSMGRACYIESALEARSAYMLAVCDAAAAADIPFTATDAIAFAGGTNGTQSTITDTQYAKAMTALSNANVNYTHVLGLGCYSSATHKLLADLVLDRRIEGFIDFKGTLTYAEALAASADSGLVTTNNTSINLYHFPFTHKDQWTSGRVNVGLSGAAYAA
ncbi:hypothetical protein CYR55_22865, partial [Chimaeribacter californicus]